MKSATFNTEAGILKSIAGDFPRHPRQLNGLLEADAEIIRLSGKEGEYLVLKTDGIHEEIKEKLYDDPYLIGWMTVTAPISDIAAVGAQPTGILFRWYYQNIILMNGYNNLNQVSLMPAVVIIYI